MTQHVSIDTGSKREFTTGANRDTAAGKLDYEGFLSPLVVEAFGRYMDFNRHLADGSLRASDNWQLGIPQDVYVKSAWRHFIDWWKEHRGHRTDDGVVWACLGLLFNLQGYLHERLKADPELMMRALLAAESRRAHPRVSRETARNSAKFDDEALQSLIDRLS